MESFEQLKKFKVGVEMEAYGKDGKEVVDGNLWEEVEVEALNREEAQEKIMEMDFGNRKPSGYMEFEKE
jgi:hypothetical protein